MIASRKEETTLETNTATFEANTCELPIHQNTKATAYNHRPTFYHTPMNMMLFTMTSRWDIGAVNNIKAQSCGLLTA